MIKANQPTLPPPALKRKDKKLKYKKKGKNISLWVRKSN